jgi:hypothetical protein
MISSFLTIISYIYVNFITEISELLMEFLGILVIGDIDNWIGMFFEYVLQTFYDDLIKVEDYL